MEKGIQFVAVATESGGQSGHFAARHPVDVAHREGDAQPIGQVVAQAVMVAMQRYRWRKVRR